VQIFAELEGMAAEEVEQFVTRPVEVAMRGLPGVKKIRSISSLGLSTVNVYFEDDVDIYLARQLVAERLKEAEEGIPEGLNMPHGLEMGAIASGMGKILSYYVEGDDYTITELRTIQDWIVKRGIQTVSGVAKVVSQGGHVRQYQIKVHPDRLLEYDLTLDDVIGAVQKNNSNLGAGIIEKGAEELIVRSLGLVGTVNDIENIVLSARESTPVFVKDVATVEFGNAFRRGVALSNGQEEVVLGGVYRLHGANSFEVIGRLKKRIAEINETLPEGVRIVPFYDQSALVTNSINTIRRALVLGLALVCLVSFVFLGNLRNALIVVCSLPFSTLFAFILMHRNGIPGDLISLGGIAIALGMIVDATIIMVEKIQSALSNMKSSVPTTVHCRLRSGGMARLDSSRRLSRFREIVGFHHGANSVVEDQMGFLYQFRAGTRRFYGDIGGCSHLTAVRSGQRNYGRAERFPYRHGFETIVGVAGCRDSQQNVARPEQRVRFLCKRDVVCRRIVLDSSFEYAVESERYCGQPDLEIRRQLFTKGKTLELLGKIVRHRPFPLETFQQLADKMHRVGIAASVTAH